MSLKTLLLFAPLLVLALMTGWRSGANAKASASQKHAATAAAVSPPADANAAASSTGDAATHVSPEAALAAVQTEFQRLKDMEDESVGAMRAVRTMARMGGLVARLTPEQQKMLLDSMPSDEQKGMVLSFFAPMLSVNQASAEHFERISTDPSLSVATTQMLISWALHDPAGALRRWKEEMAKEAPARWAKESAGMLFSQLSAADSRLALREAKAIGDPGLRKSALESLNLASLYIGDKSAWPPDGEDLLRRLIEVSPDSNHRALQEMVAMRLLQETPEEALAWIESLELGADSAAWTDQALAEAWSRKDRPAAADWWLSRAAPEAKAEVTEKIVRQWTDADVSRELRALAPEADLAGCAEWLNRQGIGPDTEKAVAVLAEAWIDAREPAAALAWARAITGEEARAGALKNITTQIRRRYPDTWRAMLKEAGVSIAEESF